MTSATYIVRKSSIAYCLFAVATCYIISPWFVEKKLLFNELIAFAGLAILLYKRGRIGKDPISLCVILLLFWGLVHAVVSVFRMDTFYYYLRNLVIIYSIMAFFAGYYCLRYLGRYIDRIRKLLRIYTGVFLFLPISRYLFERFGMAMLFPALFRNPARKWVPWLLLLINVIYGFTYDSLTALVLAMFYFLLFISPGYKFFRQVVVILLVCFILLFIYLVPYLDIIRLHYTYYDTGAIHEVMRSNRILGIDGNNTWRLVLWKEILVDHFPANLFGIGFGTPALKYFPVKTTPSWKPCPICWGRTTRSSIYSAGWAWCSSSSSFPYIGVSSGSISIINSIIMATGRSCYSGASTRSRLSQPSILPLNRPFIREPTGCCWDLSRVAFITGGLPPKIAYPGHENSIYP